MVHPRPKACLGLQGLAGWILPRHAQDTAGAQLWSLPPLARHLGRLQGDEVRRLSIRRYARSAIPALAFSPFPHPL